ncbi:MAG: diguanylate cyclase [Rhodospirillales bacterium]|nr:diguanylate cyclase [Rhodospirillales bacterium]
MTKAIVHPPGPETIGDELTPQDQGESPAQDLPLADSSQSGKKHPADPGCAVPKSPYLDLISNLVCFCRGETVTYVNPAGIRMLNAVMSENVIGRPFSDFVAPDFGDLMALGLETFAREEIGTPLKLAQLTGTLVEVNMVVTALQDENGPDFMIECRDVSELLKIAESNRIREQRIKNILNTVGEAVVTIDTLGTIKSANPAAENIFGYSRQELMGRNVNILMPEPYHSEHDGYLFHYLSTGEKKVMGQVRELQGRRKDGSVFPIELAVSELREKNGSSFTGVVRDITARKLSEERIKFLAHHDPLTGLPNRNLFDDRLQHALTRAHRENAIAALMFIDLDHFKPINDNLGHEAGDFVLKGVAGRLIECVRNSDTVARLGGDEFVVILENLAESGDAGRIAASIIKSLTLPFQAAGGECAVGASIGISLFPFDGEDAESLIKSADSAMYKVKEQGRNNFMYYQS